MFGTAFLILLTLPLLEIGLFVLFADSLGIVGTLAEVVGSAVLGLVLLARYRLSALTRSPQDIMQLAQGGNPMQKLIGAVMLPISAILLLIPGFFTDTIGLALLLPPVRHALGARAMGIARARMQAQMQKGQKGQNKKKANPNVAGQIIEGEFTRKDDS